MATRAPQRTLALLTAATIALTSAGCKVQAEPTGSTTVDPHVTATGSAKTASQELGKLEIGKPASMKGYSREKFPHWRSTGKNCDVRDSVLKRDGSKVKLSGCNVVAGTWKSVYDDKTLTSPTQVDIDHVVPLANAWRSGAASWTTDKREDFANDLDDPQLVAVSAGSNRSKGDQDPSTWKPPATDNWCHYAESWIAVKTHWKLTVTTAEKSALADMLEKC
ncbi:HNH endonuclease family protein [Actinoplanes sp. NPDC051411]|uniref:HNH endonuclease family protein n=1 Tax=Actinoplanes sp. NPDC051411 TaxID=3155522 RepID=UPI003415E58B